MHSHFVYTRAFRTTVLAVVCTFALGACAGDEATEPDSTPSTLIIVQGTNQAVQGGKELPNAIVLRVLTSDGRPVEKVPIGFTVATGGGSVTPGSVLTDANGEARTKWVLGPTAPEQMLKAEVAGIDPVTISATAISCSMRVGCRANAAAARPDCTRRSSSARPRTPPTKSMRGSVVANLSPALGCKFPRV